MKRPYDLVAFMKQEERANMLDHLKQELLARKDEIDKTEDRDTGNNWFYSKLLIGFVLCINICRERYTLYFNALAFVMRRLIG